jgi:hypothetical protein
LRGLTDILYPPNYVGRAKLVRRVSGGVHGPAHLAYLVRPALKRRNSPADKTGDDVLRRQASTADFALNSVKSIDDTHSILWIIGPVLHVMRWDINISRQIKQIHVSSVLHIE